MLLSAGWAGDPKLKILCGGEPLSQQLAHALLERGSSLWNLYGPTETTIWSSVSRITGHEDRITIGRPIANTQFFIMGENLQLMPEGIPGELYIGGDGLARGYWNRPELTAQRFVTATFDGGPSVRLYRTGDRAKYLRGGQVEYLGRLDDQVKIRGHRIEPAEVEFALKRHAKVRDAIVVARTDSSGETKLIGYIIPEGDSPTTSGELRNFLQKTLPAHFIPAAIIFVREFPLTPNGKLDRSALPQPVQDTEDHGEVYVPPRNTVERRIAAVWSEILQIERIGTFDNFFELGGHSLSAMRVVVRLSQEFGIEVSIRVLFEHPSVDALAGAITQFIQPGSPEQN
jgi:acyl-coenzyme A synthetase/AMP-(fatty) acid ligase/acyl carrier protein